MKSDKFVLRSRLKTKEGSDLQFLNAHFSATSKEGRGRAVHETVLSDVGEVRIMSKRNLGEVLATPER